MTTLQRSYGRRDHVCGGKKFPLAQHKKAHLAEQSLQNAGFGKVSYPHLEVQKPIFFETSIWCPTLQGTVPLQGTTPLCFEWFTIILYKGKRHLQHSHQLPHRPKIEKDLKTSPPPNKINKLEFQEPFPGSSDDPWSSKTQRNCQWQAIGLQRCSSLWQT